MSFSDPVQPIEPSTDKYWITELNKSSVKSPFEVKFTLIREPQNEPEILAWLNVTYPPGSYKYKKVDGLVYAEIFFKDYGGVTMLVLKWGESFT